MSIPLYVRPYVDSSNKKKSSGGIDPVRLLNGNASFVTFPPSLQETPVQLHSTISSGRYRLNGSTM